MDSEINFAYNVGAAIFGAISLSTHSRPGQAQPWCRPLLQVASSPRDWSSAQSSWAQGCCRVSHSTIEAIRSLPQPVCLLALRLTFSTERANRVSRDGFSVHGVSLSTRQAGQSGQVPGFRQQVGLTGWALYLQNSCHARGSLGLVTT